MMQHRRRGVPAWVPALVQIIAWSVIVAGLLLFVTACKSGDDQPPSDKPVVVRESESPRCTRCFERPELTGHPERG